MKLDLRFSDRPLESLWCQAVAALVFQGPNLTEGALSGLNEKMAKFLSHLQEKGFWTASRGETVLLASQDAIRAEKILLKGLGESTDYDKHLLVSHIREVGSTFNKMEIKEFGIHIPVLEGSEEKHASHLEMCARQVVNPFFQDHRGESDFVLKIIFSVENCTDEILGPVAGRLREYFDLQADFSVVIDLESEKQINII
jgi:hypothetical protein